MVDFILELNRETNSLCKIKKGKDEIRLNEKELSTLIEDMYDKRPDVFQPLLNLMLSCAIDAEYQIIDSPSEEDDYID